MVSTINGLKVSCSGDIKDPAIVFLHGFPFDGSMWQKQIDALQGNYYCITYDIRGLGTSDIGDGQYTIEFFVDDLIHILDSLKIEKASLCALSMGGYIALRAVEREPHRFARLILCDTRADVDDNNGKIKRAANCKKIAAEGTRKFVSDFLPNCVSASYRENNAEEYAAMEGHFSKAEAVGMRGCQIAMMGRNDMTNFLQQIQIPTLVLCGEVDTFSPTAMMKGMADKIPGSQFVIVPGAAHLAPLENPNFVNPVIVNFLGGA